MNTDLPDPASAPELFEGVLTRRVIAYCIDAVIILFIVLTLSIMGLVSGFMTLGLAWIVLPLIIPAGIVAYYAFTLGSPNRATVGMAALDIVLTPTRAVPLDGWKAFLHTAVFWITIWIFWPFSLLFALFTPRRQMLHDLIVGTLMVRRSPMERHWANYEGHGTSS